jgi:hypothetical protein
MTGDSFLRSADGLGDEGPGCQGQGGHMRLKSLIGRVGKDLRLNDADCTDR